MTVRTSGVRQPSVWAGVVSDGATGLRAWLEALGFGAAVVHELTDQTDYPSRDFTVADPDGNHWAFATFAG